jgi:hypothetical protein
MAPVSVTALGLYLGRWRWLGVAVQLRLISSFLARLAAHAGLQRRQRFRLWRRRLQLRQDRFQRIEPRRKWEGVIFERAPEMGGECSLLVIGKVERHNAVNMGCDRP